MPQTAPQQSTRSFVAPVTGSVKQSVSVKEYMTDIQAPIVKEPENIPQENILDNKELNDTATTTTEIIEVPEAAEVTKAVEVSETPLPEPRNSESEIPNPEPSKDLFLTHWKEAIDLHFQKQPTVYFTLKEYQPEITNNIIYLTVKNELQKEEIEEKKRALIIYLRNNYKNEIEDIEILVNEEMESKIKLLDERDKLKLLHEQNSSLSDFMKILNMNIKE